MVSNKTTALSGVTIDEHSQLSMLELCRICGVQQDFVLGLVDEGVIEPGNAVSANEPQSWLFSGICVQRTTTAFRLYRDLDVNLPGIALALDLLDKISELKKHMH